MALDFDALQKKLRTLKGLNNRSAIVWKPTAGRNIIRIVPWVKRPNNPFIEFYFHYLGGKTYLSPKTFDKPDPIEEFGLKIQSSGIREDWLAGLQFIPKPRTFVPMFVRGKESEGIKFFSFGKQIYEKLLLKIQDPDWGDFTDPVSGRDITLDYTTKDKSDTGFAKTEIDLKPNTTPISAEPEVAKRLLTEQPDIYEAYELLSYEQLHSVLEKFLDPENKPATTETAGQTAEEPAEEKAAPSVSAEQSKSAAVNDAASEFDKLFSSK